VSERARRAPRVSSIDRFPVTPDERYFVAQGKLWRRADPTLPEEKRKGLVKELMAARRAVAAAKKRGADVKEEKAAHAAVDAAKRALGERGPVWWTDGAADFNRQMAKNTPYAEWFAALPAGRE
jgi:hypothetical protein